MRTRKRIEFGKGLVMTTAEYLATPESVLPTQLHHEKWMAREAPTVWHQDAVGSLFVTLRAHLAATGEGKVWVAPVDVVLDYQRALVVQPDVVVVSTGNLSIVTSRINGAPDLVIEVLSPTPRVGQIHEKLNWFARYGVRECWVVHLDSRRIEVLNFGDGGVRARRDISGLDPMASEVLPTLAATAGSLISG